MGGYYRGFVKEKDYASPGSTCDTLFARTCERVRNLHLIVAMNLNRLPRTAVLACLLLLASCAAHPFHVSVAGIRPQKIKGLGMQMMVNLRVQNPNDSPIDY